MLEETESVALGDGRRNARLREVLPQLGATPTAGIPAACGGHAEMTSAYRFFDNGKATFDRILASHAQATRQRRAAQTPVVLAQDTTEITLARPEKQVQGAGPLDGGTRRGLFLHPLHAFTPDGTPLGTRQAFHWVREDCARGGALARAARAAIPYEHKESFRWLEMQRAAQQEARHCPRTRLITVGDSEADIYELLAEPQSIDWIVRGGQDRAAEPEADETANPHLYDRFMVQPVLYSAAIRVRGRAPKIACDARKRRQPRKTRAAQVEVRSSRVTLRPPPGARTANFPPPRSTWCRSVKSTRRKESTPSSGCS